MYLDTTKYNAANMYHSTTQKLNVNKYLSTMMLKNAQHAKNGFATNNANMFQNTTGNILVVQQLHATKQLLLLAAVNNRC